MKLTKECADEAKDVDKHDAYCTKQESEVTSEIKEIGERDISDRRSEEMKRILKLIIYKQEKVSMVESNNDYFSKFIHERHERGVNSEQHLHSNWHDGQRECTIVSPLLSNQGTRPSLCL